jgi:hypothetical protein
MKTTITILIFILIYGSSCNSSRNELYKETDKFVQSLETTYESYGFFGGLEYSITTSDGLYTITPIGRLINVKIQKGVNSNVYIKLKKSLERHYKNDSRVNQVYICNAGTIMVDCRNH